MKWTKFFLLAVLGIGLVMFSCSNDDDPEKKPSGANNAVAEGDAYLAINIRPETNTPKLLKYGQEEVGKPSESLISNVLIVLYNIDTENVEYSGLTTISSTGTTTKAVKVKRNRYKLLVLVNPKMSSPNTTIFDNVVSVGKSFGELYNTVYHLSSDGGISDFIGNDKNYFFMINPSGWNIVEPENFYNTPEEAESLSNAIKVYVERAVGRIEFYKESSTTLSLPNGTIKSVKWGINNQNQVTYIKRHYALMAGFYPNGDPVTGGAVMEKDNDYFVFRNSTDTGTSGTFARVITYAQDPNFNQADSSNFLVVKQDNAAQYIKNDLQDDPTNKIEYVLENTMSANQQLHDRTTGILVQVQFSPNNIQDVNEGFYTFRGKIITATEMKSYADTANVPTDLKKLGFIKAYNEVKLSHGLNDSTADTAFEVITSDKFYFRFYQNSMMYYFVPIRHFNDKMAPQNGSEGRFGVVRNNLYRLKLTGISGIGSPTIPNDKLNDETNSYLSVYIQVMPWLLRDSQDVDLN